MNQFYQVEPSSMLHTSLAAKLMNQEEIDLNEDFSESSTVESTDQNEEFSFERLDNLLASDEWDKLHKQDGLVLYARRGDKSKVRMVRLYGEFPRSTPKHVYECMFDAIKRGKWDKSIVEHYEISRVNESTNVLYTQCRVPVISARDVVEMRMKHERHEDEHYEVISRSIEHDACPPVKGVVRGQCMFTGNRIYRKDANTSIMEMILHYDPCGSVPKTLVNCSMKVSLKKFYADLKKGCASVSAQEMRL